MPFRNLSSHILIFLAVNEIGPGIEAQIPNT